MENIPSEPGAESKEEASPADSIPVSPSAMQGSHHHSESLILAVFWLLALSLVLLAGYEVWHMRSATVAVPTSASAAVEPLPTRQAVAAVGGQALPVYSVVSATNVLIRRPLMHTIIPSRPRQDAIEYTVETGDSVFAIAKKFNLKPESILWANYDQLQDAPDALAPGMTLKIPPLDGVYYQWKEGDTLDSVASYLKINKDEILNWPGNKLDLTDPVINVGDYIMAPGGQREFKAWFVPQIARGKAGVSKQVYGPGACDGGYEGAYGSGGFIWPSGNHFLSGNDFWSGHLGIDIAGATGDLVWASDSGVVLFAGWSTGGYGNMVMIDHGNGYQTVYGHLNTYSVSCGQSIYQGNVIGTIGSTGNSTGSHLHFEIRLNGQFVDPWYVLP